MFTKDRPPLVLFFGGGTDTHLMGLLRSDALEEAFGGVKPKVISVSGIDGWWFEPLHTDNLARLLLDLKRDLSADDAKNWVESPGFVTFVRHSLLKEIEAVASLEELPVGWQKRVTLAFIGESLDPKFSSYTRRVFEGMFSPETCYRSIDHRGHNEALWRDRQNPKHNKSVGDLDICPYAAGRLASQEIADCEQLVEKTEADLFLIMNFDWELVDEVIKALEKFNLQLAGDDRLALPLDTLDLPTGVSNRLKTGLTGYGGKPTIGDLVARTESDLLTFKLFGNKSLEVTKKTLAVHYLRLRGFSHN